jgi:hypothetical protein
VLKDLPANVQLFLFAFPIAFFGMGRLLILPGFVVLGESRNRKKQ